MKLKFLLPLVIFISCNKNEPEPVNPTPQEIANERKANALNNRAEEYLQRLENEDPELYQEVCEIIEQRYINEMSEEAGDQYEGEPEVYDGR